MYISVKKLCCILLMGGLGTVLAFSQDATAPPAAAAPPATAQPQKSSEPAPVPAATAKVGKQTPQQEAWEILRTGVISDKTEERATAVRVLSLMRGQPRAIPMARKALDDEKPEVRAAAANALGELHSRADIPKLKAALDDNDVSVVLAAAHALVEMKNPAGYALFYEILTGDRKGSNGLVAGQLAVLKDPKKMALLGFQEGIGFIPFAGMGYAALKTIMKDDNSPVRAAAARVLAGDRDPATGKALAEQAVSDKNELVRTASLQAIASRNDPSLIDKIVSAMFDTKDSVKYTAAAVILHLSAAPKHPADVKNKVE